MTLPEFAIEAEDVVKIYPATKTAPEMHALRGLNLKIPRGSIFGLLGPNGAGKSTFINTLAGLTKKTSGTVKIWDRDIDVRPRDARAAIGVVPQEISADPFFTPRESLEVQAGMYGVPAKERRTMELLNALGLGDKAEAYVRQLSGGMKRRLMVAKDIAGQVAGGSKKVLGVMVESHLCAGAQKFTPGKDDASKLTYGQSITDACIGWDDSEEVLQEP